VHEIKRAVILRGVRPLGEDADALLARRNTREPAAFKQFCLVRVEEIAEGAVA
jgi:hypothetical protein